MQGNNVRHVSVSIVGVYVLSCFIPMVVCLNMGTKLPKYYNSHFQTDNVLYSQSECKVKNTHFPELEKILSLTGCNVGLVSPQMFPK